MGGRIIHAGFIFRRQLGAPIETTADGRGSVFDHAVAIAVAGCPPPIVVGPQHGPGFAQQIEIVQALIEHPADECADRRLASIDPGVPAGEQAGQIARLGDAGEDCPQVLTRNLGIEHAGHKRMIENVIEPDPETAKFLADPIAAERGVGAAVHRIPDGVPAHDIAYRIQRTIEGATVDAGNGCNRLGQRGFSASKRHGSTYADGGGKSEVGHFLQVITQHGKTAILASGVETEIALGLVFLAKASHVGMECRKQGRPLADNDDVTITDRRRKLAGLWIVAPLAAILAVQRQHHPEPEAPFRHLAGLPAAAKREGIRLVVCEHQRGSGMLEGK